MSAERFMQSGIGRKVCLTGCFGVTNQQKPSGSRCARILCAQVWCLAGKGGLTRSVFGSPAAAKIAALQQPTICITICNCRAAILAAGAA